MQAIFLELVKLSLIGSLFAAAVMLVRLIFPKMPKWLLCLLWGVVALRLICPVTIESRLSLVPDRIASGQIITSIGNEYIGGVDIIYESNAEFSNAVEAGRQPVPSEDTYYVVTEKDSLAAPKTVEKTLYPVLSWIWAAGMVLMLGYTVVSYTMLRRKMAEATHLRDNIWQCELVDSPFVLGLIRPKIYLPYSITDSDMANVIAHEKAHIHRKDHWWKPLGFILLSIHWFNPVLWLAYILLCRDIEAACDEKVIKRMEKDEVRAYSTALLNCSVNRRRIAACPLAFGEVGVKERVKTVMNYKKPALWIVIAAVALCAVVAVSFLTNPKDYSPEVGNPKMLEFPGVKWLATPEEVIAALELTEEQIRSQTYSSPDVASDSCYLSVINIPYFDQTVSYATFDFQNNNGKGYRLSKITLYLDENADMEQVNATLEKAYGQGTGESYLNYDIGSNGELREFKSGGDATLNYLAKTLPNSYSAQSMRDAVLSIVDDPEYTIENWVSSTKGTEVLTADEQALIAKYYEDNSITDRETVLEWLEKTPLVAISTMNRSLSVAMAEADNSSTLATNNQVIYSADMLLYFTRFVEFLRGDITPTEPTEARDTAKSPDVAFLEFPEVSYGMEPYQIKEEYGLTDEHILSERPDGDQYILHVKDISFFGAEVASAKFIFLTTKAGQHLLSDVMLYYPEGTDMAAIKTAVTEFYTEPVDGDGFTRYRISDTGVVESYTDYGIVDPNAVGTSAVTAWWESEVKLDGILGPDIQEMLQKRYVLLNGNDESWADAVWEYLGREPSAFICCTDSGITEGLDSNYCTKNIVSFSAYTYISTLISYH